MHCAGPLTLLLLCKIIFDLGGKKKAKKEKISQLPRKCKADKIRIAAGAQADLVTLHRAQMNLDRRKIQGSLGRKVEK